MASANPSSIVPARVRPTIVPHVHNADDDLCPTCEQPIPHDRAMEIRERLESHERARDAEIASKLEAKFTADKVQALQQAAHDAERAIASARDEARTAAETAAQEKLNAAERANAEAAAARTKVETELTELKAGAAAKEAEIRVDAERIANEVVATQIAEVNAKRVASETELKEQLAQVEADRTAAQDAGAALEAKIIETAQKNAETLEQMRQDAAFHEAEVRREVTTAAEAAAQEKVTSANAARIAAEVAAQEKVANADTARIAAEASARTALAETEALKERQETQLHERLTEQREALEAAKTDAVNAEKAAAFKETMRLSGKVEELQRTIDKKTADELGEGAEINLYDALKVQFEGDRVERVKHGLPGADIIHTVIHNGRECGKIIYDSKNHGAWRNEFVTKLKTDQMAAKAEHAILSTSKFPAGGRQLQIMDGVVLASPARIVALVQLVRQHLVQSYTLRLSAEQRTRKTDALYDFVTSERCANLLARFDAHAIGLLELQDKERKAHEAVWRQQGNLITSVQRVSAELCREIDEIIGSDGNSETIA